MAPESIVSRSSSPGITVLLVDDQTFIAEAVRRMLRPEVDIQLVHCAESARALDVARAVRPTLILQDLIMPGKDGMTLVEEYRRDDATRAVPLVVLSTREEPAVKAEAFARGASDYLVKLPDRVELVARIRAHALGYIALQERDAAYRALLRSQENLQAELAEAAAYVRSLMPAPIQGCPSADWRFLPSRHLGGDALGYHWVDPTHLAMYVLDVSGHGVGPALLSVSVLNVLRSQSLPGVSFLDPAQVLSGLNDGFTVEECNAMSITTWYGVYDTRARRVRYASGGHPPAVLVTRGGGEARPVLLDTDGVIIGLERGQVFEAREQEVAAADRLYLLSDGAFEVTRPDGTVWSQEGLVRLLCGEPPAGVAELDWVVEAIREVRGSGAFEDDFSLLRFCF